MNIFLTGGSSGIGRCIEQNFSAMHSVTAPNRQELDLSKLSFQLDLSKFDCIILCAGSDVGGKQPFASMMQDDWLNTFTVNFLSNIKIIQDYINSRGDLWSKIIVVGSNITNYVWPNNVPYGTSKVALESFATAINGELPSNIGITILRPGLCKTSFNHNRYQGNVEQAVTDQLYNYHPCMLPSDLLPAIDLVLNDRQHLIKNLEISKSS
jgi:NADP-dependent 3-hydroxy acid dehydrogenase YdfG